MLNSLPLMNTTPNMTLLALFVTLNLLLGLFVLRHKLVASKSAEAALYAGDLTIASFSQMDHPALQHEELDPLAEAELYVIYGRQRDAQRVLDLAMREGRISAADVVHFWAERKRA